MTVKSEIETFCSFFEIKDENGETNREKAARLHKVIRRVDTTSRDKSYEEVEAAGLDSSVPYGVVIEDGKVTGFGIHILNEDIYPLQSFEIYLRNCGLTGTLDLSGMEDMIYLDIYHNNIPKVITGSMPAMRIFGIQDNDIEEIDISKMPSLQGIDAGMNRLHAVDVSKNGELVELYINDNDLEKIDLSGNMKLKYFYCHNNRIESLDTTENPLLRHIDATDNPMKEISCLAPMSDGRLPLRLLASEGGYVGLRCNPVYNAQWKETGEWQQGYFAYPAEGFCFSCWKDEEGKTVSRDNPFMDVYGTSRVLEAVFEVEND